MKDLSNPQMKNTLEYIIKKYYINPTGPLPIEIPNVGRNDLVNLFHELDFKVGVEIGVAKGDFSKEICEINPQAKVYGVDAWTDYSGYNDRLAPKKLDVFYEEAKKQLAPFANHKIIKGLSMDAVKNFEDNSLDFVYIDANHEDPYVTEDIVEWSKKVRSGGIVSGHDYYLHDRRPNNQYKIIEATNKYTRENNIKPWFVLGLSDNIPGLVRDDSRSWFWVKP